MPRISPARELPVAELNLAQTVQCTYVPVDRYDPNEITWNGVRFKANVPVTLDRNNRKHSYEGLEAVWNINHLTGQRQSEHVPVQLFMGDVARGNPSFEVDGVRAPIPKKPTFSVPLAGVEWDRENAEYKSHSDLVDESVT